MRRIMLTFAVLAAMTLPAAAKPFVFSAIEGGEHRLDDWWGGPVLVVNTASMCGFTYQYEGLQDLWEAYRDRGLTVLAVPSDAFNQEYASNERVKEFCEANFAITLPMTEVTEVKGAGAHPFYVWLREAHGFTPRWNFNKVLLDGEGRFVRAFGSNVKPGAPAIRSAVEAALAD